MEKYSCLRDVKTDVKNGKLLYRDVFPYCCKGELFLQTSDGSTIYSEYIGTYDACKYACYWLALRKPEHG